VVPNTRVMGSNGCWISLLWMGGGREKDENLVGEKKRTKGRRMETRTMRAVYMGGSVGCGK